MPRAPSILVTSFGVCMQMSWKVIWHLLVKRLNGGCNLAEAFALKSEELACEHGVIMKDESNYFIDGEVSSHKLEAG